MSLWDYLWSVPEPGHNYWLTWLATGLYLALALLGGLVRRNTNSRVTRQRFRELRNGASLVAVLLITQSVMRAVGAPVLSYRLWFYLIAIPGSLWLLWWMLKLRSLQHDLVVERQNRRQGGYMKRGRRRHR